MDWCNSTDCDLSDSTRTTNVGGSVCTDFTTQSDLTSDISSTYGFKGSLADYQIQQQIGRGKYSQVYIGVNSKNDTVAIKRVQIFDMMDASARQACLKEVKHLQNLEHPNIVKCYNSFIQDNELIIILEWAQAGDLGRVLKERLQEQRYFPVEEVWRYFLQVCSAVKHMHDRRMMHRDLKPSNIFITADGTPKLGDLGLSRYFSSRTVQALTTVGTPYYMSPECIKGQPYDFSSDIWSLGVLLYEMITLKNPFYKENQSLYALGKTITTCAYEPLGAVTPAPFRKLVSEMLQAVPQNRPTIDHVLDFTVDVLCGEDGAIAPGLLPPGEEIYLQKHLKKHRMRRQMRLLEQEQQQATQQQLQGAPQHIPPQQAGGFGQSQRFDSQMLAEQQRLQQQQQQQHDNDLFEREQELLLQQQLYEQQQLQMQQKMYEEQQFQLQMLQQQQQQQQILQEQLQQQTTLLARQQQEQQLMQQAQPFSLAITGVQKPISGTMPLGRSLPRH